MRSQILVAGVDSSTQACKIVVRDASSGLLVREGRAPHPPGTEVDPAAWLEAFELASERAGGLDDVAALGVAAQQHGAVCLTEDGKVVRPAMLWNDLRSGRAADDLVAELGGGEEGRRAWADAVGLVPVASFTVTKLRWIAEHEPALAATTAAVCLPHDWLTWQLMASDGSGRPGIARLTTDRGDASGTGYWSATSGRYRLDILERAFGSRPIVPRVVDPSGRAGLTVSGAVLAAGTGDNAAAALGVGAGPGDVVVSIGTSGTVSAVADAPVVDASGTVAGFADATGRHLPLVCTVNASRVLERIAAILRVGQDELSALALSAPPGAGGLVLVPYLEGERTPNRPDATGALLGLDLANTTPAHLARAAVEGMLCGLADGLDALRDLGVPVRRILLVGGASRSDAVRRIAPSVLGQAVVVPPPGEYVADGAARQAAWALDPAQDPPSWPRPGTETYEAEPCPQVRDAYAAAREHALDRERGHQLVAPPA